MSKPIITKEQAKAELINLFEMYADAGEYEDNEYWNQFGSKADFVGDFAKYLEVMAETM